MLCIVGLYTARAERSIDTYRRTYDSQRERIDSEHAESLARLLTAYDRAIEKVLKNSQKEGELDTVLAAKKEQGRFEEEKSVPKDSSVRLPEAIQNVRRSYHAAHGRIQADRALRTRELTERYVDVLDKAIRELTKAGELEEAVSAKEEKQRAEFILADSESAVTVKDRQRPAAQSRPTETADIPADDYGKPANMSKPVQVYILLGQSNMVGAGKIAGANEGTLENAVRTKKRYPYLVDDAGQWTARKDVRYVRVMGSGTGEMRQFNNEWMTIKGEKIGPEFGIGHYVGRATSAPVMILKSCIGNRSLGWDLLPPGSERYEVKEKGKTMVYAGYKDSPARWEKGTRPKKIGWYAGAQYDGDVANAKKVLAQLNKYYPGARKYEVAGFFFWQGDRDCQDAAHANRYEQNLVQFIKQLRKDFNAPKAKFVVATLGQTRKGATGNQGKILEAQLAVDGRNSKYPEFKGNVASVYSHPFCHGGTSRSHYDGNAETYMDVGETMGQAMVELMTPSGP